MSWNYVGNEIMYVTKMSRFEKRAQKRIKHFFNQQISKKCKKYIYIKNSNIYKNQKCSKKKYQTYSVDIFFK